MAIDSIPARLLAQGAKLGDKPAYYVRSGGAWTPTGFAEYASLTRKAARSLIALGLEPGGTTCILGFNRPEWVVFDLATMMAGGAPAGIYTTCSPTEVAYIIQHSEAEVVVVENVAQWEKVKAELDNLPKLRHVVLMKGATVDHPMVMGWDDFMAKGDEVEDTRVEQRLEGLAADQVATFIYTSGTTGPPKAVMLSHHNLTWTADKARQLSGASGEDSTLSYLPLSHIAEQMFTIHSPISTGYCAYFAESIEKVPDNLREVEPTVVFGVPRIWEKMHAKISSKMSEATGAKAKIVKFAMEVGHEVTGLRNQGKTPGAWLGFKHRVANRLVYSKVKALAGLTRARMCVTGAAPIAPEILEFFAGLDLTIHEVYGMSEDTGPTSFNIEGQTRYGTVGKPVSGTDVKIAPDGEILVRGPHVFMGYYKDEAATNDALVDGWLHSGDLGELDPDGYLKITGRKKEIIITAGGKNIAPKNIEAALKNLPLVAQAVVIGDRRKFLSALVTLDPDAAAKFAASSSTSVQGIHADASLIGEIQRGVDEKVNTLFARVEHVRKFTVLPRDFTVDDGELTPTLKIKRSVIYEHFSGEIEAMYAN
jgi:long-chain acyl-CoA synthetase